MPALPSVAQVIKIKETWSVGLDVDVLTHHYLHYSGAAPTNAELQTLCVGVGGSIGAHFLAQMDTATEIARIDAVDLSSPSSAIAFANIGSAGTNTNFKLDGSSGTNVQSVIARRYRGGKPRTCWPIGTAFDLGNRQQWSPTYITGFSTLHAAFESDVLSLTWTGGGTLTFVSVSYFEGFTSVQNPVTHRWRNIPSLRVGGPVVDPVTGFLVHQSVGQVSRRGSM